MRSSFLFLFPFFGDEYCAMVAGLPTMGKLVVSSSSWND